MSNWSLANQGLKPRFVKAEPPSDADSARVLQPISRRVIRTRRHLGYLEAGIDAAVAPGYDPLLDNAPALAHTMAASVKQRIALTTPWSDGTTGITLSPLALLEKLAALVPLPRVHLVRYAGCLAPHSQRRGAIIPTPRQQGVDEDEAKTGPPSWSWARLLGRVFALDMATCPLC